jgi:hypothetical protein
MSTEEAVLFDDVPCTLAHVENDLSRDGLHRTPSAHFGKRTALINLLISHI